ncbi:MAG: hypothetical protein HZA48_06255 [Planctomycetes bacterium]|nr:hypothetical protein [Planctomycetota bacterium]
MQWKTYLKGIGEKIMICQNSKIIKYPFLLSLCLAAILITFGCDDKDDKNSSIHNTATHIDGQSISNNLPINALTTNHKIIEYYIPKNVKNSFYAYVSEGVPEFDSKLMGEKNIAYIKKEGSEKIYGEYEINFLNGLILSHMLRIVDMSNDEVKLIKKIVTNSIKGEVNHEFVNQPVILKLPSFNEKLKWEYCEDEDQKYVCTAELIQLTVDGKEKETIKVSKEIHVKEHSGEFKKYDVTTISYYVKGIGFYKEEMVSATSVQKIFLVLKKQTTEEYMPAIENIFKDDEMWK